MEVKRISELKYITTDGAPAAVGPYSQGVVNQGVLYCSGALPLDPASGEAVEGSIADQAERCLLNLEAVCQGAGTSLDRALQVTVYTTQIELFGEINAAYTAFFENRGLPARVTIGAAELPLGARVEISAVVAI